MSAYIMLIKLVPIDTVRDEFYRSMNVLCLNTPKCKPRKLSNRDKQLSKIKAKYTLDKGLRARFISYGKYDSWMYCKPILYHHGWNNLFTKEMFKAGGKKSYILTDDKEKMIKWLRLYIATMPKLPKWDGWYTKAEIIKQFSDRWEGNCIFVGSW